jgi:copper transport protein
VRRLAALAVVIGGAWFALAQPQPALGHAALRSSDPTANAFLQRAPGQITLSFTEPVDNKSSSFEVLDASGKTVKLGTLVIDGGTMTAPVPQLEPGIYNVLWSNVSRVDGHAIRGSFPFTVLRPDGTLPSQVNTVSGLSTDSDPRPLADGIAVRALSLLGLVIVVAGALITLLWEKSEDSMSRKLTLAVYVGAGVLLAATLLNFATIRNAYSGLGVRELVFQTPSGGYWLTRLGLVLLITVATTFMAEAPRRTAAALMACVGIYLWAFTATSHAAAGIGSGWSRAFDFAHGASALTWIGAVTGIALAARFGSRESPWARLLPRFSLVASAMVFIILTTGLVNAFVEIEKPSKLWDTRYGLTLLIKLGLMLPLLAVAGYNARWGKVRLLSGAPGEHRRFLRFAMAEAALGLMVFAAAAALTQTTVSKSVALQPESRLFDQSASFSDLGIHLLIDPNHTGLNTYRVDLKDASGTPVSADRIRLIFRYQDDANIGASSLTLSPGGQSFVGQGPFMTLEGRWRIEVEIRRPNADDVTGFFDVRPAGAAVLGNVIGGEWSKPTPGLTWNQFGGIVFVLAGLGFALSRTPVRQLGREAGWAANGASMAGFAAGVLLLFGVHSHTPSGALPTNPIFPDANSIAQGRAIFQSNCAACHGQSGVPPKGLNLNPYPLDLTVHVPQHPDGQLHEFISQGIPGSAMRAWSQGDGKLSDEQIWHVVNYLHTLTPQDH